VVAAGIRRGSGVGPQIPHPLEGVGIPDLEIRSISHIPFISGSVRSYLVRMAPIGEGERISFVATLCVIVATGAWLRFHNLGASSLWTDEIASWFQSKDSLADLIRRTAQDNYPPLHNLFLYASINLFGDGEWSLRLPSAIFGTANILAIYWLGSMTVGRIAGLLAATFLALSGYHVWYSQDARMYALLSLTATLFAASSFYFVRSPTIPRAALVSLAGLALLYSHPFGILNWIAIVTAISLFRLAASVDERRTVAIWITSNVVTAVGFAPWAWLLLIRAKDINSTGFWIPHPSPEVIYKTLTLVVGGQFMSGVLLVGIALATWPAESPVGVEKPKSTSPPILVFLVWAGLPIALALLASIVSTPIFYHRYLIGSLPPLLLTGCYGLSRLVKGRLGVGILVILSVPILAISYLRFPVYPRAGLGHAEDWRGVSTMLEKRLKSSDCVLFYKRFVARDLSYYYRKQLPCQLQPSSPTELDLSSIAGDRLFVIFFHVNSQARLAEKDQILEKLRSGHWSALQKLQFRGVQVIEFGKVL